MSDITNRGESAPAARRELDAFLADLKKKAPSTRGRLLFALDATAGREATWDTACKLQADMFREAASAGGLDLQLVYYRGLGECKASGWISDPLRLGKVMSGIMCRSGHTQTGRILDHAVKETRMLPVSALVFVGDAFEEEADTVVPAAYELGRLAGCGKTEQGSRSDSDPFTWGFGYVHGQNEFFRSLLGVRVFMFQEGDNREVERVFRQIADATKGAYCRFDQGSAHQLAKLLRAVAVYASGGKAALAARKDPESVKLLSQMR